MDGAWLAQKLPAPPEEDGAARRTGGALLDDAAAAGVCVSLRSAAGAGAGVAGSTNASAGGQSPSAYAPLYCKTGSPYPRSRTHLGILDHYYATTVHHCMWPYAYCL